MAEAKFKVGDEVFTMLIGKRSQHSVELIKVRIVDVEFEESKLDDLGVPHTGYAYNIGKLGKMKEAYLSATAEETLEHFKQWLLQNYHESTFVKGV